MLSFPYTPYSIFTYSDVDTGYAWQVLHMLSPWWAWVKEANASTPLPSAVVEDRDWILKRRSGGSGGFQESADAMKIYRLDCEGQKAQCHIRAEPESERMGLGRSMYGKKSPLDVIWVCEGWSTV